MTDPRDVAIEIATKLLEERNRIDERAEAPAKPNNIADFPKKTRKERKTRTVELSCLSDVVPQPVSWLWLNRIPCKLVLFTGPPDCGKTTATMDISARVTMGKAWPDGSGFAPFGSVIFLTAEDGLADTIRTRADAAGADVKKIYVLKSVHDEEGRATTFDLQQDLVRLAEKVSEIGDVRLIVVDPITAYMGAGKLDTHKTADVRAVLSPLTEFSDKHGVAVIGLTHPSKSVTRAMNAATGSQGFIAAARAGWMFLRETGEEGQETGRTLMLPIKNNLSPCRNNGLAFRIAGRLFDNGITAPYVTWDREPVAVSADQALAASMETGSTGSGDEGRTATDDAIAFLRDALKDGPVAVDDIEEMARAAGLLGAAQRVGQYKPFRKAREELGVETKREGFGPDSKFYLSLPRSRTIDALH